MQSQDQASAGFSSLVRHFAARVGAPRARYAGMARAGCGAFADVRSGEIFVEEQVLRLLDPLALAVIAAHEVGHVRYHEHIAGTWSAWHLPAVLLTALSAFALGLGQLEAGLLLLGSMLLWTVAAQGWAARHRALRLLWSEIVADAVACHHCGGLKAWAHGLRQFGHATGTRRWPAHVHLRAHVLQQLQDAGRLGEVAQGRGWPRMRELRALLPRDEQRRFLAWGLLGA